MWCRNLSSRTESFTRQLILWMELKIKTFFCFSCGWSPSAFFLPLFHCCTNLPSAFSPIWRLLCIKIGHSREREGVKEIPCCHLLGGWLIFRQMVSPSVTQFPPRLPLTQKTNEPAKIKKKDLSRAGTDLWRDRSRSRWGKQKKNNTK